MTKGNIADIKTFRNEIIVWGLITAAFAEVMALLVIGLDFLFFGGLVLGTAISVLGFFILTYTGKALVGSKRKSPVFLGYLVRIVLYAAAFLACLNLSTTCAFGCGIGFVTVPFGIMFLYGIYYRFIKKKENPLNDWTEKKEWRDLSEFDEDDDW